MGNDIFKGKSIIYFVLLPVCLLVGTAAAQPVDSPPTAYQALIAAPAYETPGTVLTTRLIPGQPLSGLGYQIAPRADPAGMLYQFRIDTDYGTFEPQSLQMMRVRLTELRALARLRELSEEPLFIQGMGKQLEKTAVATGKALMSPIKTIKQIPGSIKEFTGDIQAQQAVGQVYGESGTPAHAQVKRELASRLGVDPYTDNQPLQDLLNEVARNQNRGRLVASIGTFMVGGAGIAMGAAEMNQDFQSLIRDKSAAQLQVDNHTALLRMGCSVASVEQFLVKPGYTASNCTAIARAVSSLASVKNVCGVLEALPPAQGPESVLLAQTQIQMAEQFHRSRKPLVAVKFVADTAVWSDADGVSYVFTPLEHLYWNAKVDIGFSNIRRELGNNPLELWISGTATDTAKAQLAARGIAVKPESFKLLWPQS